MKDFVPKESQIDVFKNGICRRFYSIKDRCNNPNSKDFKSYGGRGIKCEFIDSKDFYSWYLEQGIEYGLDVDRIDNNGNYSRTNCQLITKEENILKQDNINLTVNDVIFIRSADFVWDKHKCSDDTINNILKRKTFIRVTFENRHLCGVVKDPLPCFKSRNFLRYFEILKNVFTVF